MPQSNVDEMQQVTTYRDVEAVLRSDDFTPALHLRDSRPLLDGCVLTLVGEEHRERRKLQRPLFERRALAKYERDVLTRSLVVALEQAMPGEDGRRRIDLLWLTRMVLVPVTAAMVGLDGVDTEERIVRLEDISRRLGEGASVEWSTRDHGEVIREALTAREEFVAEFYGGSLTRRRELVGRWRVGDLAANDLPIDLITVVLRAEGDDYDEDLWLKESTFFVVASANTTTHATPHVFDEIARWIGGDPERARRLDDVAYLRHAVEEGLRLHGPVPGLLRRARREVALPGDRIVESGEDFACMLLPANTDHEVYGAGAEAFDPDRPPVGRLAHGLSFGAGAHLCSGRPLAVGLPPDGEGNQSVIGVLPRLMQELLRRGARPDPDDPPRFRTDTAAHRYETYPLVFAE